MIIYPQSFVLSAAAAGANLYFPRIGYQTFTFALSNSDVTVSSETTDGPADAPLTPSTDTYWEATGLPATWEIDLGATRSIDYAGIAGHTIGTSGASVLCETSMGDFIGSPPTQVWTELGGEVLPNDNSPLLFLDDARDARYVRFTLSGTTTVPKVSVFYTGVALVMERQIGGGGFVPPNLSRNTVLNQNLSQGGQFLGQNFRRMGVSSAVPFEHLDPAWVRTYFDPFSKHARSLPYFFAWQPEDYPLEVAYVWTAKDIIPTYMGVREFMQVSWNMQGIGWQ